MYKISVNGRTHGAPYSGHGYVPAEVRGSTSLLEIEHINNKSEYFSRHLRVSISYKS